MGRTGASEHNLNRANEELVQLRKCARAQRSELATSNEAQLATPRRRESVALCHARCARNMQHARCNPQHAALHGDSLRCARTQARTIERG
jgi:hypothetical protein